MYRAMIRPLLFRLEAEQAHRFVSFCARHVPLVMLSLLASKYATHSQQLSIRLFGRMWNAPIALAAGFDKDAKNLPLAAALGFGGVEVGTITPQPQAGNKPPRLFRLIAEESIQNAMGFNNSGQVAVLHNLSMLSPFVLPIGVNIGKNKDTPNEKSLDDYLSLIKAFAPLASYLVVNISSPNTPHLRDLQNEHFIGELFCAAKEITDKPIMLKIAPDMPLDAMLSLCVHAISCGASGIIASNTTTDYSISPYAKDFGGISGALLAKRSYEILKFLAKELFNKTILISVGGIQNADDVYMRLRAGASLVQLYTALVYHGPMLIWKMRQSLIQYLERDGFQSIADVIGVDIST